MIWQQIQIQTTAERAFELSESLEALGASAVSWQDAGNEPILEPAPGETPLWTAVILMGLFPSTADILLITAQLNLLLNESEFKSVCFELLGDQDWQAKWQQDTQPIQIQTDTQSLWIWPSHLSTSLLEPNHTVVRLSPGLAFGTGTHLTTAMCLEYCVANPPIGQTVIDYGCGSGILAIAALQLGADFAWAVDHDPQALQAAWDNAKLNHIDGTRLHVQNVEPKLRVQADLLLANILAAPLVSLAFYFSTLLKPGGVCVLSGLLQSQEATVWEAYQPYFQALKVQQQGDWMCLSAQKSL